MRTISPDSVNRRAWSSQPVLRSYGDDPSPRTDWWSDAGERAALLSVASEARGRPILELGVGGGRLVPVLRLLSDDYLGIDYTPEMVALCRAQHPEAAIELGDARDLRDLPSAKFGLVVFSFNGIDAINDDDRRRALDEVARVLAPGGYFLYSTHNKSGPCFRASPWRPAGVPQRASWPLGYRALRHVADLLLRPTALPRSLSNFARLRHLREEHGSWAIGPVEAHDFGLLIHYTTFDGARNELEQAGLELIGAFDAEAGRPLRPGAPTGSVRYFHLVARKPPAD